MRNRNTVMMVSTTINKQLNTVEHPGLATALGFTLEVMQANH